MPLLVAREAVCTRNGLLCMYGTSRVWCLDFVNKRQLNAPEVPAACCLDFYVSKSRRHPRVLLLLIGLKAPWMSLAPVWECGRLVCTQVTPTYARRLVTNKACPSLNAPASICYRKWLVTFLRSQNACRPFAVPSARLHACRVGTLSADMARVLICSFFFFLSLHALASVSYLSYVYCYPNGNYLLFVHALTGFQKSVSKLMSVQKKK